MQKVYDTIANNWVSWMLELLVLSVIAWHTISENQKTQEHTRQMITNFETKLTQYASDRAAAVDDATNEAKKQAKDAILGDSASLKDRFNKFISNKDTKLER